MNTDNRPQGRTTIDSGAAALWASAMVILALIIVQAGRLGTGNPASAESVTSIRDMAVATIPEGSGWDLVAVLDGRSERLMLYAVQNARSVELYMSEDLGAMFSRAGGRTP